MKVTTNADGSVTVTIPKVYEAYDPVTGELTVSETLPAKDFAAALPKGKTPKPKK